jgi:hypothetical protein
MNDEKNTSNPTATAELDQHHADHPADRRTDAGLGMFERVNNIVGTTGIGVSSGVGGALEPMDIRDDTTNISGTDETTGFTDEDDRHWRETHTSKPVANAASNYEEYQPAYQYGTEAARRLQGKTWNEAEGHLEQGWDKAKGESSLTWAHVKDAVRDAWHRITGDTDPAGR